jgi:hypothetical protein
LCRHVPAGRGRILVEDLQRIGTAGERMEQEVPVGIGDAGC